MRAFAPPVRVSEDNWKINGCPESGPVTISIGHRVYVGWMTETDQQHAGIRLSWTDDEGKNFAPALAASDGVLDANHPSLFAAPDGRGVLVFQGRDTQNDGGWTALQPYLVEIDENGRLSKPQAVTANQGSASYPVVAAGGAGRVFVA